MTKTQTEWHHSEWGQRNSVWLAWRRCGCSTAGWREAEPGNKLTEGENSVKENAWRRRSRSNRDARVEIVTLRVSIYSYTSHLLPWGYHKTPHAVTLECFPTCQRSKLNSLWVTSIWPSCQLNLQHLHNSLDSIWRSGRNIFCIASKY